MSTPEKNVSSTTKKSSTKNLIIFFISVVFFASIGLFSSYLIKPTWTVDAEIDKSTINELGNYYSLFSMYQLVSGEGNSPNKANDIVYNELKRQISSYDAKRIFWENSNYYKLKLTGDNQKDLAFLDNLINSISFTDNSKENISLIQLELDNPKQAMELLTKFIDQANINTRQIVYAELISQWKALFKQVNTATELNLGKIQNGNMMDNQDWLGKLNMMKSVSPLDNKLNAYRYVKQPRLPLRSSPNHLCWSLYGGGVGLILGLIIVCFRRRDF